MEYDLKARGRPDKLCGVHCEVKSCIYHGDGDCCNAPGINVGAQYSSTKDATFCATYTNSLEG